MSNWLNLVMSVLLMALCLSCFMEIGHRVELMAVEADFMPEPIMYHYKFYNQDWSTLLSTIVMAVLSLFYLWRFVTINTTALVWKEAIVFFIFVGGFINTAVELGQKRMFQYDMGYSCMLGLTITISILFLWLFTRKESGNTALPITDILDEPYL